MSPSGYEPLPLGGPAGPRSASHAGLSLVRRFRSGSSVRLKAILLALAVGTVLLMRNSNQVKGVMLVGGGNGGAGVGEGEVGEGVVVSGEGDQAQEGEHSILDKRVPSGQSLTDTVLSQNSLK